MPVDKKACLEHLQNAMGNLYNARYSVTGTGADSRDIDVPTFNAIASLQDDLQSLITSLQKQLQTNFSVDGDVLVYRQKLKPDELEEVKTSGRGDLAIEATVLLKIKQVILETANGKSYTIPFDWFTVSGDGTAPDFNDVEPIDYGQGLRLGKYEASMDAVLYDFDSDYRRKHDNKNS